MSSAKVSSIEEGLFVLFHTDTRRNAAGLNLTKHKGYAMSASPTANREAQKRTEVLAFLHEHVFDSILSSQASSEKLKKGVRYTIMRMNERDAAGIVSYYWSAIVGTDRSTEFARSMRSEGFTRFEEVIDEFRDRFNDRWLRP